MSIEEITALEVHRRMNLRKHMQDKLDVIANDPKATNHYRLGAKTQVGKFLSIFDHMEIPELYNVANLNLTRANRYLKHVTAENDTDRQEFTKGKIEIINWLIVYIDSLPPLKL